MLHPLFDPDDAKFEPKVQRLRYRLRRLRALLGVRSWDMVALELRSHRTTLYGWLSGRHEMDARTEGFLTALEDKVAAEVIAEQAKKEEQRVAKYARRR